MLLLSSDLCIVICYNNKQRKGYEFNNNHTMLMMKKGVGASCNGISRYFTTYSIQNHYWQTRLCEQDRPKMLIDAHKNQRMASVHAFFWTAMKNSEIIFSYIVPGDEMWISYMNVESNSMEWCHWNSLQTKNFKETQCARKIMVIVFCSWKGILLVDLVELEMTVA